ncbi:MAG: FtsQ-type POTRA domain-containing protein [Aerococcus sp.]|nr:FtsQ-type POTRA domain-containing protein [Aerococcus sp.]
MVNWDKEAKRYHNRQQHKPTPERQDTDIEETSDLRLDIKPTSSNEKEAEIDTSDQSVGTVPRYYTSRRTRRLEQEQAESSHSFKPSTATSAKMKANQPEKKQRWHDRLFQHPTATKQPKQTPRHFPWREARPLVVMGSVFGALCLGGVLWLSPLTHVSAYQVSGNQHLSKETILKDSGLHAHMTWPWVMQQGNEVNRRLQKTHLNVQNATLERKGRTVIIKVQEYRPVAKIFKKDTLYPVMENQTILPKDSGGNLDQLPLLESFTPQGVKALSEQLGHLPQDVVKQIKRVTNIETNNQSVGRIALEMRDGNIIVSFINVLGERMAYYPDVKKQLGDKQGLINMEAGIFYAELTPENNPYATKEEKSSYLEAHPKSSKTSTSSTSQKRTNETEQQHSQVVESEDSTSSRTSDAGTTVSSVAQQ